MASSSSTASCYGCDCSRFKGRVGGSILLARGGGGWRRAALGGNKSGSRSLSGDVPVCGNDAINLSRCLSLGRGFCCKSAVLELLDSFSDQLVKLLRLRGERLHLVLSELRLKRQNLLKILRLGDLFDQRES